MKSTYRKPLIAVVILAILSLAGYLIREKMTGPKIDPKDPHTLPDTNEVEIQIPERFVWQEHITKDPRVLLPVRTGRVQPVHNVKVRVECVLLDGKLQPVIHMSFESISEAPPVRMDAALTYRGFEENKFTTLFPFERQARFQLPSTSQFIADTTALSILGSAQFPKLENYRIERVPTAAAAIYRHNVQISKLGKALSYRFRLADLSPESQVWRGTEDLFITTPACPNDESH